MRIVLVSQRIDYFPERREVRDALDQSLVSFLLAADLLAIPVPNSLIEANLLTDWIGAVKPAGILLSGGNDIGEYKARDDTETQLLNHAIGINLPVLGICRGMQMIGKLLGSQVIDIEGHVNVSHEITGEISGFVNSYHAKQLSNLPNELKITARASDGAIEAIRHESLPWEGWMWHPERSEQYSPRDVERCRNIFS